MTPDQARSAFVEELVKIAPDLDPGAIAGDAHIQDDLELDSMDVLNLVAALHARLRVDIPEADYPSIATADSAAAYLAARAA